LTLVEKYQRSNVDLTPNFLSLSLISSTNRRAG
jgi:hypothetical protein